MKNGITTQARGIQCALQEIQNEWEIPKAKAVTYNRFPSMFSPKFLGRREISKEERRFNAQDSDCRIGKGEHVHYAESCHGECLSSSGGRR
jgi:hypothetical protein